MIQKKADSGYFLRNATVVRKSSHYPGLDFRIPKPRKFDVVQANMAITSSGLPNIWGCRIPVYSRLNIPFFRSLLKNYWDSNLCEFLEFGFPIGLVRDVNALANQNHKGAEEYPTDIVPGKGRLI